MRSLSKQDFLSRVRLNHYASNLERGRSFWMEVLWLLIQWIAFSTFIPGSQWRVAVLKIFGASIGHGVVIKPGVRIKFPWKLSVGDYSWIGENVWIDNLAQVDIGSHCCISQGAYLCTGSHNWSDIDFSLITKPIMFEDGVWISAMTVVAPGLKLGRNSVLGLGSVALSDLESDWIYMGNPAQPVKRRYA